MSAILTKVKLICLMNVGYSSIEASQNHMPIQMKTILLLWWYVFISVISIENSIAAVSLAEVKLIWLMYVW